MVVETGEESSPGRATHRVADEGLFKGGALLSQQGTYLGHLRGRGVVQVVGEDEDYVWLLGSSRGLGIGYFLSWCKPCQANKEEGHRTHKDHKKHSSPGRRPTTAPY